MAVWMAAPPIAAEELLGGCVVVSSSRGSQTQPALFMMTTTAPNRMSRSEQMLQHSAARSLGTVSVAGRATVQPETARATSDRRRCLRMAAV
ncbi:hypothetical protein LILAB_15045 [Corallococcus macrosporus]|uniref:Uncharacterized protein n=1 Tax=Myxococcus fulvus (strain ATCC BAA-855 / HW-1) TaxID=483219 RepID=F8CFU5_MYXFH|nr:hypothetical protein LILAB_15045 [Corallococcus macrosporus]